MTCAVTLNVLVLPSSDSSPVGGSAGTVNLSFGRPPGPSSLPSESVSRRWLLLIGDVELDRLAELDDRAARATAIENC